jgi:hypothetical protein
MPGPVFKQFATSEALRRRDLKSQPSSFPRQHRVRRQHQRSFNVFTGASCHLQKALEDPLQRIFHETMGYRAIDTRGVLHVPSRRIFFRTLSVRSKSIRN